MPGSQKYSPNSSNVNPKYFLGLLDISKETPNTVLLIGLIEDFSRNSVNFSDCRTFSLFEAVTSSLTNACVLLKTHLFSKAFYS